MEAWAGAEKKITMCVKPGDENYAEELIRFMYTEKIPFSAGIVEL